MGGFGKGGDYLSHPGWDLTAALTGFGLLPDATGVVGVALLSGDLALPAATDTQLLTLALPALPASRHNKWQAIIFCGYTITTTLGGLISIQFDTTAQDITAAVTSSIGGGFTRGAQVPDGFVLTSQVRVKPTNAATGKQNSAGYALPACFLEITAWPV
jgi:hypothetical protein